MGIKQPPAYVHPNKRKAVPTEPVRRVTEQASKTGRPKREKERSVTVKQAKASKGNAQKTIQLRLVMYPPTSGQIPLYDQMITSGFEPKAALLGLLKRGFPTFEKKLLAGSIKASNADVETLGTPVETTRSVSPQFLKSAKDLFDPFSVLSDRALGRKIAEAIVSQIGKDGSDGSQS